MRSLRDMLCNIGYTVHRQHNARTTANNDLVALVESGNLLAQ